MSTIPGTGINLKRAWAARPKCGDCQQPLEEGRRHGRCGDCRKACQRRYMERYRKEKLAGKPPRPGGRPCKEEAGQSEQDRERAREQARRVEVYAGIIASGRRLFE